MKNWAGNIEWNPAVIAYPKSVEEIQHIVMKAVNNKQKIRLIGSGHSFTALCETKDILISLDKYQGVTSIDKSKYQATVKAGTKLNILTSALFQEGLAMENLGDIDVQSLAGAISTGTHGTGKDFGTLSTQVIALRFINGKGEIISCSETENRELFKAAQVSMGIIGIITEITLQCIPAYILKILSKPDSYTAVMADLDHKLNDNRNFEFFWLPYTDTVISKTTNIVEDVAIKKTNIISKLSEYVLENYAFMGMCEFAKRFPSKTEAVSMLSAKLISEEVKINHSHKIYATTRLVKFREMEYNIPAEAFQDVMKELTKTLNSKKYDVHFPIECRWVRADDIMMSPAHGRDSAYIACHVYKDKDCGPYFKAMESILRAYGGRPHWGKMHTLTPQDIADIYPQFSAFMRHREQQDPEQVFITSYLSELFGITHHAHAVTT